MTKRYTDDDVARLVEFVKTCFGNSTIRRELSYSTFNQEILNPFLPDPEDVLIEKMVEEYNKPLNHAGYLYDTDWDTVRMRAVLAVVKQEGLPE